MSKSKVLFDGFLDQILDRIGIDFWLILDAQSMKIRQNRWKGSHFLSFSVLPSGSFLGMILE